MGSMDASVSPMATSTQQQTHDNVGDVISAGQSTLEALMEDTTFSENHENTVVDITVQTPPSDTASGGQAKQDDPLPPRDDAQESVEGTKPKKKRVKATDKNTAKKMCMEKCLQGGKSAGDMTKCNLCMEWFHDACLSISDEERTGLWMCTRCRNMPHVIDRILIFVESLAETVTGVEPAIRRLTLEFKEMQEANCQLVYKLTEKVNELNKLYQDNGTLREQLKMSQERLTYAKTAHVTPNTQNTLVVGTSVVKHMESVKDNVTVSSHPGAHISTLTQELQKHDDNSFTHVILQAGTNDCTTDKTPQAIVNDYKSLLVEATRVSVDKVTVSTVLPRMDNMAAHQKARTVNEVFRIGAKQGRFSLVDNDKNFRLRNDCVDDSLYWRDNLHLNRRGTSRLIENYGLTGHVEVRIQNDKSVSSSKAANFSNAKRDNHGVTGTRDTLDRYPSSMNDRMSTHGQYDRTTTSSGRSSEGCVYCGERNHTRQNCRHGTYINCDRCKKPGHKANRCSH